MSEEIKIIITPMFRRMVKKLKLNAEAVEGKIKVELQKYVDENPESLYFPDSGAGIGNVWKIRVDGRSGYRAIYFAYPKSREFYFIVFYAKNQQENLSNEQAKQVRKLIVELEKMMGE